MGPDPLARLVEPTTDALAALVDPDGVLHDPVLGGPTPPDHYGTTFAALALAARDVEDDRWRALIRSWTAQAEGTRGHAPFNRLALLLLRDHLRLEGALGDEAAALVQEALGHCPVARTYPSNNWVLLARTCDVIEAGQTGRASDVRWAAHRFDAHLARWLTSSGGFVDFPSRPRRGRGATPITYHAKALVLMTLVETCAPRTDRQRRLSRAARWLWTWMDDGGLVGGFGRSTHALFGTACALFVALRVIAGAKDDTVRAGWRQRLDAMAAGLERTRRPDGLLPLNPHEVTGPEGGWDGYMHVSVYNAFAAGLLAFARAHRDGLPPVVLGASDLEVPSVLRDTEAGLVSCRGKRAEGWISLRGQPVQGFTRDEVDLRYGALQPWHVQLDGKPAVPPPVRVPVASLREHPYLAGWTPTFLHRGRLYDLHLMDWVEVQVSGNRLIAVGWCVPILAHDVPRSRGTPGWWAENLDHYLMGGRGRRRRGARPVPLRDHHAVRSFVFDGDEGWWAQLVVLRGRESEALFLNPHGHTALDEAADVCLRTFRVGDSDGTGPEGAGALQGEGHDAGGREVSGPLPSALPGGIGSCAPPVPWPAEDQAFMTICGVEEAVMAETAPARVHLSDGELMTGGLTIPLGPRAWKAGRRP